MKAAYLLVLLSVFTFSVFAHPTLSDEDYQRAFTEWMHKHTKKYSSEEFKFRFDAFKSNIDFVNRWDSKKMGFEVEMNHFADMTLHEFSRLYLGTKITVPPKRHARVAGMLPGKHHDKKPESHADDTVDWRTKGPIKDQGQCGSCWSFSTTGSTEGAWFKKTGTLVSLSEQQLVDCSTSFGNQGCDGGLMDQAFQYIIKNGIVTEASYPYTAADGTCNIDNKTVVAHLASYQDIEQGNEADLTKALDTVGPISVAIDASHSSFQLYSSGVYYEKHCSASSLDHGVLTVGYGTDSTTNDDYYIVKNSWGVTWGMQGYINMSRNKKNNCGIATMASYPVA